MLLGLNRFFTVLRILSASRSLLGGFSLAHPGSLPPANCWGKSTESVVRDASISQAFRGIEHLGPALAGDILVDNCYEVADNPPFTKWLGGEWSRENLIVFMRVTLSRRGPRSYDRRLQLKRPSVAAIFVALIPFVGMCFSVSAWDRIYPMVLGLPFNLFWLLLWTLLTPICMWCVYRLEVSRKPRAARAPGSSRAGHGEF
jgi:hypothetical protein